MKTKELKLTILLSEKIDLDDDYIYALNVNQESEIQLPKVIYLDRVEKRNGLAGIEEMVLEVKVEGWML
jgi:phage antirepressor YoqD-like protein